MSEKKNILYISIYTEMGGGEYGLLSLIRHLDRDKFNPIVCFNSDGPFVDRLRKLDVEILIVPFLTVMLKELIRPKILWQSIKASFILRKILKGRKIDLIQCSDVLSLLLLLPTVLLRRIPLLYSVIFFYEDSRAFLFNILALLKVKKIVTLSKMVTNDLLKKTVGLKDKMQCIYWGVDTTEFYKRMPDEKLKLRQKLGLPLDKKIIGFIGRYDLWKGHLTFLEAMELLLKKHNDICFLIVGGAMTEDVIPEIRRYHRQIENIIAALNVKDTLTVWQHRDDIPEIMACLDLFVCPSDYEPFGLVVLEAVSCGIPIVVSSTVGAIEVLEGWSDLRIAEPRNSVSFAARIEEAVKQRESVLPTVSPNLPTWAAYAREYEVLYEKLFN